jgi:23S rRNA (cytosine1962-C5)-methyltransferase
MHKLTLKSGREKSLKRRHPWIFSGAVEKVSGELETGETVEIHSATGEFLAVAAYSPQSQIVARVWDWRKREIDASFFRERIERAGTLRSHMLSTSESVRLVHAESDGLPGIVVDRYGEIVVLQLSSAGAMRWRDALVDAIEAVANHRRYSNVPMPMCLRSKDLRLASGCCAGRHRRCIYGCMKQM